MSVRTVLHVYFRGFLKLELKMEIKPKKCPLPSNIFHIVYLSVTNPNCFGAILHTFQRKIFCLLHKQTVAVPPNPRLFWERRFRNNRIHWYHWKHRENPKCNMLCLFLSVPLVPRPPERERELFFVIIARKRGFCLLGGGGGHCRFRVVAVLAAAAADPSKPTCAQLNNSSRWNCCYVYQQQQHRRSLFS